MEKVENLSKRLMGCEKCIGKENNARRRKWEETTTGKKKRGNDRWRETGG